MIDDAALVKLCAATYESPASLPVPLSGTYVCTTKTADGIVFAFRGSITLQDWLRDFFTITVKTRDHPQLGFCHAGFLDAADSIVDEVIVAAEKHPIILTGHSLGGAEAVGVGGLLVSMGIKPAKITTFGAPRFGMKKFVDLLSAIPIAQYRRGNDPVPKVPIHIPHFFPYLDTREPLIGIGVSQYPPNRCHAIAGYMEDVAKAQAH